ncbi:MULTISPECIES: alpha-amylase family glycosyl hydrolase [unclassified Iodidimonas]|jgi:glycosidase|uniref:alpha-amylase family glycosyl hydrolase n=1 Tax=unclassified Iodidimonas TaxID=2626145 RepID=UPI00248323BC|nr:MULTISPECIES: alpha-amylase family glycosyl hydrolase [unclassified Iodidimonas]
MMVVIFAFFTALGTFFQGAEAHGQSLISNSKKIEPQILNKNEPHLLPVKDRPIKDDVIYFMLPDRFYNGDPANDRGGMAGSKLDHGFDPTHKAFYHGGDLKGVIEKLDYLEGLGITAIWMAPIFKNKPVQGPKGQESAAYHGYWITDFTRIDPHFGSNQDLKDLVRMAHDRGIKVIFDIITNHTADVIQYQECQGENICPYRSLADYPYTTRGDREGPAINQGFMGDEPHYQTDENFAHLTRPDWAYSPFVPKAEADIKVPQWLNDPIYYHNRGETTFRGENSLYGDFAGLDDLFTEHPRVLAGMIEIYKFWIKEFGIDGFRIDTVRHVNMAFWQRFVPEIRAYAAALGNPHFYVFGEVYDPDPKALSQYVRDGKFPAVLDFGFQSIAQKVLIDGAPTQMLADFFAADRLYQSDWSDAGLLPTFLGNHDMGRFGHFLLKKFGADADDEMLLKRLRMAHALMFFARGVPVIYSGDEQGFTGDGHDQDAREDMFKSKVAVYNDNRLIGSDASTAEDNFDPTHPLYRSLGKFAALYRAHPALRRGEQISHFAAETAGIYAFSRIDVQSGAALLIAINSAETPQNARLSTLKASGITADEPGLLLGDGQAVRDAVSGDLQLHLPPLSFAVWGLYDKE